MPVTHTHPQAVYDAQAGIYQPHAFIYIGIGVPLLIYIFLMPCYLLILLRRKEGNMYGLCRTHLRHCERGLARRDVPTVRGRSRCCAMRRLALLLRMTFCVAAAPFRYTIFTCNMANLRAAFLTPYKPCLCCRPLCTYHRLRACYQHHYRSRIAAPAFRGVLNASHSAPPATRLLCRLCVITDATWVPVVVDTTFPALRYLAAPARYLVTHRGPALPLSVTT